MKCLFIDNTNEYSFSLFAKKKKNEIKKKWIRNKKTDFFSPCTKQWQPSVLAIKDYMTNMAHYVRYKSGTRSESAKL